MRVTLVLSAVFGAGCATWRAVEAPVPYETLGYLIEVQPRVRTDGIVGLQEIRGTVRSGTDLAVDIIIVLYLFDDAGGRVGQAIACVEDLRTGTTRKFEAGVLPWGVPDVADEGGEVPKYRSLAFSRVEPGYVLATPTSRR
jgi:hypothetical protein